MNLILKILLVALAVFLFGSIVFEILETIFNALAWLCNWLGKILDIFGYSGIV